MKTLFSPNIGNKGRLVRGCGALALLRGQEPGDPGTGPVEILADELLRLAPALPGQLPPLLVATRASAAPRPLEPDPLRALAVLTHLSGRTCVPGGTALLSEALLQGHPIDLWTAEDPHV